MSTPSKLPASVYKPGTLDALAKQRGLRLNRPAALLLAEFLRLFTAEAVHRAAISAKDRHSGEGRPEVTTEDIKGILAELLLDF